MARLELSLFGGFAVRLDGRPVTRFKSDKTRALLAYLAVEAGRPHRREQLATLLWPERPEAAARANLSQAIYNLRCSLGERGLSRGPRWAGSLPAPGDAAPVSSFMVTADAVQFDPAADHQVDVTHFASLLQSSLDHAHEPGDECDACLQRLGEAVSLYGGPFLQGLAIDDSAPFEEWVTARREQLHRQVLDALQRLAAAHERRGEFARALPYAWRQVELDPWREEGQRQLMRLLALSGQRSAALAQYEACRRELAEELGAEPAAETTALYEQIRSGVLVSSPPVCFRASPSLRLSESPNSSFVAREQELAHLEGWLQEALAGQGRVGFVVGEPGSGKTMLLREFARRAMEAHPDLVAAAGTCNAYGGLGDSYLPFAEILRLLTGDVESHRAVGAMSREHARRLRETTPVTLQAILQAGPTVIDTLLARSALLERMRALPDGAQWEARMQEAIDHRPVISSPAFLHDQVSQVLQRVAQQRPLLLILDDLQWADEASISLLFHLARRLAGDRVLVLGAYRPEEVAQGRDGQPHPLQAVMHELQVLWEDSSLDLAQADGRALVEALVEQEPNRLGPAFRGALYRRTGGHALFTVEFLRGLRQRGDLVRDPDGKWAEGPVLDWERLPRRVEAVIAAHIDRLPREEQDLLSVASIEGEEFHAQVVARVLGKREQDVLAALSGPLSQEHRLLRPVSLRRLGEQQFSRYRFRHYLFQRYLYQRLDPVRRAHLHGEVAKALEALGGVALPTMDMQTIMLDDRSDVLGGPEWIASETTMAWHYAEAGLAEKAAAYHVWMGRRLCYLSIGYQEILAHNLKALDLLAIAPPSAQRTRWEERTHFMVGWAQSNIVSALDPRVGQAWSKALALAEQLGDKLLVGDALNWLALYHRRRGELDTALALGERSVTLVRGGRPGWVLWVQAALATTLLDLGNMTRAAQLLSPLAESLLRTGFVPTPPWNTELVINMPLALWCLGFPDQALKLGRAAQEMILCTRDRMQIGIDVLVTCGAVLAPHRLRREVEGVERGLRFVQPIVDEHRCSPIGETIVAMNQGWVCAQRGLWEQGIAGMRRTCSAWSRIQIRGRPYLKGLIAEALGRAGRPHEGLVYLESALKQVERTGERWSEAELHRLKGELLLQRGDDPEEVEACYRQAIAVAQGQEAKSWELRATVSLARLLRGQGRTSEAREMLAAIYGWFSEGFDTPDLKEAKELLEELEI